MVEKKSGEAVKRNGFNLLASSRVRCFNLLRRWTSRAEKPTSIIASQPAGGEDQLPEGDCRKSCCPPELATCCPPFARLVRFAVSEKPPTTAPPKKNQYRKRSPTVSVTAAAVSPEDASSLHWYAGGEAESPSSPPTSRTCCQHQREKRCEHGGGCCCSRGGAAIDKNTGLN
nr:hypothetical protein Iba_chr01aCG20320 [Ipomoea batatas]